MPLTWVEPEVMIEHNGKKVYYCYRHETLSDPYTYWYNTDVTENGGELGEFTFDIRELPGYREDRHHLEILAEAIDQGLIKFPDEKP